MKRRWLGWCATTMALAISASAGSVTTRGGKTIDGDVAFASAQTLVVKDHAGAATNVAWSDVKRATFASDARASDASRGPWQHQDVGRVHAAGSAAEVKSDAGSVYWLNASGRGFWGPKDTGHLLYWPFEGDGQIIAHVTPRGGTDAPPPIAGVMFRDSTDPSSPMAGAMLYPGGEARFVRRPIEGWVGGPEGKPAKDEWVRLTRNGDELAAFKSRDGKFWQPVGHQRVPLASRGIACLAASATTNAAVAGATFDHVQLVAGPSALAYFPGAVGPASGVVLTDGTMLAGRVETIEGGKVQFLPRFTPEGAPIHLDEEKPDWKAVEHDWLTLPTEAVARVRLNPEPRETGPTISGAAAAGVLLVNGDFMECDVQALRYHKYLDVTSVLFGSKRLDAPLECLSIVLHQAETPTAAYELRLRDGSIVQASDVSAERDYLTVDAPVTGKRKYPLSELTSIECRK